MATNHASAVDSNAIQDMKECEIYNLYKREP